MVFPYCCFGAFCGASSVQQDHATLSSSSTSLALNYCIAMVLSKANRPKAKTPQPTLEVTDGLTVPSVELGLLVSVGHPGMFLYLLDCSSL
jgi:hypothetical protein